MTFNEFFNVFTEGAKSSVITLNQSSWAKWFPSRSEAGKSLQSIYKKEKGKLERGGVELPPGATAFYLPLRSMSCRTQGLSEQSEVSSLPLVPDSFLNPFPPTQLLTSPFLVSTRNVLHYLPPTRPASSVATHWHLLVVCLNPERCLVTLSGDLSQMFETIVIYT